jgi:DNA invertase Pin-like site-specific DNA recombinase
LCKVYGYCRVALASKEEIDEQMRAISNYCEGNNLKVDGFFCDDGVSGFDVGPEFKCLLGELKGGDTLVLTNLTRLSRSTAKLLMLMSQLKDMGVEVLCADKSEFDASSIGEWIEKRLAR